MQAIGLHLRTSQNTTLSPQMQQGLKILQMSALELEQQVLQALNSNALLEMENGEAGEEASADSGETEQAEAQSEASDPMEGLLEMSWSGTSSGSDDGEHDDPILLAPDRPSLRDHLLQQVNVSHLSERDAMMARLIVEALDEDGYLRDSFDEILQIAPPELEVAEAELRMALCFIQSMDPVGVGARSVAECLSLQLKAKPDDQPGRSLALRIVDEHLDLLAAHDTLRLTKALDCTEEALGVANQLIQRLSPRPAAAFGSDDHRYVIPDVVVRKQRGKWIAMPNPEATPRLRINRLYADAVQRSRGWSNTPMGAQLAEARWLMRSIAQRADTILKVAQAIVAEQQRFFDYGDIAIKPLHLRDIAQKVGVHESTVSRVTNGKYMSSPRGMIEFKHFFGSRLTDDDGFRCSSRAIQSLIRDIIAAEQAQQPLSDIKVTRMLEKRGVNVARRTVTKYRDALGIPPVEARRLKALAEANA
ncbi:MAG: RNA polymerase factor sigma-54 [Burkholderiaceae bacterium]